ncbi:MAG: UvrD-helicase domain-containing protein [Gaiellaceae bacterium]
MSSPTPEQARAIELREVDVFCEAGAGTGKTRVLVERFVSAVVDDEVEMGSILAFTFTERAADQLRGRIRGALRARGRQAAERGDEELRLELKRLGRQTEASNISTIHGFCRRLLAAHPAAAGVDPRFRVLDQGEATRLQGRAFWDALDRLLSAGDREDTARLVGAATPRTLRTIVVTAYDELRSRGSQKPELPEIPPSDPAEAIVALARAAAEALAESEAAGAKGAAAAKNRPRLERAAQLGEGAALDDVLGLELDTKAQPYCGAACDAYRREWPIARRRLAEIEMADSYQLVRELLATYSASYERLKTERSGLDFEDLQLRALELLDHDPGLRDSWAAYSHLLVDEFQDTNRVQLGLIDRLHGPDTTLFCVCDELQSIYGFRHADLEVFRSERDRFSRMPDSQGQVLSLTGNFRSRAPILSSVNAIGEAMMGSGYTPLTVGSSEQADAVPSAEGPDVELLLTAAGSSCDWEDGDVGLDLDDDEPAPASRVAEARLLARRLAELRSPADGGEGVSRGQMVVLLRSFGGVDAYVRALGAAGLDPHVVGGRGYWSQQQVEDVLALLTVIANPLDDEAVLGSLASQACGVSPDTLWTLRRLGLARRERERSPRYWPTIRELVLGDVPGEDAAWAQSIPEGELIRLREFHERIALLRERSALLGLQGTIEAATETLGYDLATLMRDRGAARWANVRKLIRLAGEYEANEGADLRGFLAFAAEEGERAGEGEAPIAAEEHDGVRIMTVHAAKGLEFDVVAVPELGRRLMAGFPPSIRIGTVEPAAGEEGDDDSASPIRLGLRLARLGRPSEKLFELDELTEIAERDEAAEELRLAHVAATRARERLVLSGTFSPAIDRASEMSTGAPVTERILRELGTTEIDGLISERASGAAQLTLPAASPRPGLEHEFAEAQVPVIVSFPEHGRGADLDPPTVPSEETAPSPEGVSPPLLDLAAPPASAARLSYSALSLYERCGYRFLVERELGLGPAEAPLAISPAVARDEGGAPVADPAEPARSDELLGPSEADAVSGPTARQIRFGFGNAVHRLLEWSARNGLTEPGAERCARVLASEGLEAGADEVERASAMVSRFLTSALCDELRADGVVLRPEQPFLLPIEGTLIRGSIDLLATLPSGEQLVIDFKTDRLGDESPDAHLERYEVQRAIYALAAASGGGPVRTAYSFLEGDHPPVEMTFGDDDLAAARESIEELLYGIAGARFEVTNRPHASLCADCPARERLCSHRREDKLRELPDPPIDPSGPMSSKSEPPAGEEPTQMSLLG